VFERFTASARELMVRAQEEARGLGHTWLGTEHLLLALTDERAGLAAAVLRGLGVTRESLLAEYRGAVGTCEPPAARGLDPEALATLGIDLSEVKRRIEESFGPGALELTRAWRERDRLTLTPRMKKMLEIALREALRIGEKRVRPEHLLMAVFRAPDSLAGRLLARRVPLGRVYQAALNRRRRSA
jgi:ATP-dependent Clp protease ATP-binding subunit ClpA